MPSAGQFVPLTPAQIVTGRSIPTNQASKVSVRGGVSGIPGDADVAAVALSLSASSTVAGQLVAYPTGTTRPTTANLHFRANKLNRAFSVVKTNANGELDIYNLTSAAATVDVAVEGYWLSSAASTAQSTFVPLTTTRLDLDPNSSNQFATIPDNNSTAFNVLGVGGIPDSGVSAVVLNVSGRASVAPGYLTAYADDTTTPPAAPMVQYETANVYKSNLVVSKVGSNGKVRIYHNHTSTSTTPPAATVVAEVVGYFTTPVNTVNAGATFVPITSARVTSGASLAGQATATVSPLGLSEIPDTGVSAVAMTVTANSADSGTQTAATSFLVVHPSGTAAPTAPWNVAYEANQGYFNGPVTARLGSDGKVSISNRAVATAAPVKIWVDVFGYFKAPTAPAAPTSVQASGSDGEASVTWTAPASDGGAPITSYTVTSSPGGKTATVDGDQTTATVTGLTNNTAYTFTVKAKNAVGEGAASAASSPVVPLAPGAMYAHDNNGRVTAVFDGSGAGSKISYDPAGNITEVAAMPATALAVAQVSPAGTTTGETVSIYGTGFGTDKSAVSVSFNGVSATPISVDRNLITVAVPAGAATGNVNVTVAGVSKSWADFRVTAVPLAPTVSHTGLAVLDRAGSFTLNGSGFDADKTRNLVSVNGKRVQVTAATASQLTVKLPPDPLFGHVKVTTPGGVSAESTGDVIVPPDEFLAANIGTGEALRLTPGTVTTVPVNTAGHIAVALFDLPAGKRAQVSVSDQTFGLDGYNIKVYGPKQAAVDTKVGANSYWDLPAGSPPGTYAVVIDPVDTQSPPSRTGSVKVLASVFSDLSTPILVDGAQASLTTTAPGQQARFTFEANEGDRIYTQLTGTGGAYEVSLFGPDGVTVLFPDGRPVNEQFFSGDGRLDTLTLPRKGTYTLLIDPQALNLGTYKATINSVPADATATAVVDGATGVLAITKPGQNGAVSFTGSAGQRVYTKVTKSTTSSRCVSLVLHAPDGSELADVSCANSSPTYVDPVTLPAAGTYRLVVDPNDVETNTFTIAVTSVPADATATAIIDGAAGQVTTTKAGQNGIVSFTATANQRIFTKVERTAGTVCLDATLFAPDDRRVVGLTCLTSATGFLDTQTLTQAGTYRVVLDPKAELVGTFKVTITSVPADSTVSASIGGSPVTVSTTRPGQNSAITFTGTAGQNVTFTVTAETYTNTATPIANLCPPSGACTYLFNVSGTPNRTVTLNASGTYTIKIDPQQDDIGNTTLQLTQAALAAKRPPVEKPMVGNPFRKGPMPSQASIDKATLKKLPHGAPATTYRAPKRATAGLTGVVRRTDGEPLSGVTVGVGPRRTRTDSSGAFSLSGLQQGMQVLRLDGRSASTKQKTYGVFDVQVRLRSGKNRLHYTPYLPALDTEYEVAIESPTKHPVVLTNPAIPGLELHIPAGVTVLDADGKPAKRVGITQIPVNRTPIPMPDGVQVPTYFTVQPAGGKLVGGAARLVYPNYLKLQAGQRVNFWHYDKNDAGWGIYGGGQVDQAGRQIKPDTSTAIYDFDGAMINVEGMAEGLATFLLKFLNMAGDPVELSSGLFTTKQTDLAVDDVIPLELTRGYNSGDGRKRPLGMGSNDFYNMFLSSRQQYQEADLNFPDGGQVHFVRISPGTGFCDATFEARSASPEFYKARFSMVGKCNAGGKWHLKLRNGFTYVFGDIAPLQEIYDPQGNRVQIIRKYKNTYGSYYGPITEVRSTNGAWLHYTYESCGSTNCMPKILKVEDNIGRSVSYTYDGDRLKTVTDPHGEVTEYGYDTAGRITTITDARRKTYLTNAYDANGRVHTQTLLGEGTYTFDYQLSTDGKRVLSTTVTEPDGVKRKTSYDDQGYLVTDTRALGTANEYTISVNRDPATDLPKQATDGFGRTTSIDYDPAGNPESFGATAGTKSVSARATYNNTPYGLPDTVTDANNNTTLLEYDDAGNVTKLTDPRNSAWTAKYNTQGKVTETKTPIGLITKSDYVDGQLTATTDPMGRKTKYIHDAAGRVVETIAPDGTSTKTTYDAANVVKSTTDAEGNSLVFDHDENGNVLSVTDARSHTAHFEYDDADRLVKRTDPLGAYETYEYDAMGRLKLHTDRRGKVTEYRYDELGRTKLVGFGKTGPEVFESTLTYGYDTRGRLKTVADSTPGAGSITYEYDDLDRVTKESGPQGDITYDYDDGGRLKSMAASGEEPVTFDYYPNDLLWKVNRGAVTAEYTYDPDGRLVTKTLPGGVTETTSYDDASQLKEVTYQQSAAFTGNVTYTFDKLDRRTKVAGTLAEATLPQPASGMIYDAANRLTTFGGQTLGYDEAGNLTSDGTNTYQWDARSQLVAVDEGASTSTLRYDPLGRRTTTTVAGLTTGFRFDGDELIGQTGSDGTKSTFLNGLGHDETLARFDATEAANAYLRDALGSTLALTDASGRVQTSYAYDLFGNTSNSAPTDSNPIRWTGRISGPTMPASLQDNRARLYSPKLMRFISEDPIGFDGGYNLYEYAAGDPVDFTDPFGTTPVHAGGLIGACLGGGAINTTAGWLLGRKHSLGDFGRGFIKGCGEGIMMVALPIMVRGFLDDALSAVWLSAGRRASKGSLTRVGREYQKHMDRGQFPTVPGKDLDDAGLQLLRDIIYHPRRKIERVDGGNFAGGVRVIKPDGAGAVFGPDGSFGYFSRFRY
ncbi:RHS repeat-associated core domain-containing protein [Flindersiella endophytica]